MRAQRGIALLLALLVLVILIVLVGQMVVTATHNRSVADNATADLLNSYAVRAGYTQAQLYLQADAERGTEVDSVNERWAQSIEFAVGQAQVRVKTEDTGAKINLAQMVNDKGEVNTPVFDMVRRLLTMLGHSDEPAYRILDYEDSDTRGDFEAGARNEALTTLDELERIGGLERKVLYGDDSRKGILPFVTIWPRRSTTPGAGLINVNTAPAEILMALHDEMTPQLAAAIVTRRTQRAADGSVQHFKGVAKLADVEGMPATLLQAISPQLTVKATTFEIHVRSSVGPVEKAWLYVMSRTVGSPGGGGALQMALVSQQRETEPRAVKPPSEDEE
ncbi:MAG: general secretion pathway protein GspK [Planctomycetes bacterium]|nr:general secretion pathway protein GspK [Planctomycetota bacterium]